MERSAILFCRCTHYDSIPRDVKETVYTALIASGTDFETVDDLCGMAARKDEFFGEIKNRQALKVVACSRRAVKWLFHFAGEELPDDCKVSNMMELDAAAIAQIYRDRCTRRTARYGWDRRAVVTERVDSVVSCDRLRPLQ